MTSTTSHPNGWRVPFFALWGAQSASLVGSMVVDFGIIWWLTSRTGSATILAMAGLFRMLPGIVLGPFAGACVDRWNRKWMMILADGFVALVSTWLTLLAVLGHLGPWHVFIGLFARALASAFHWPAMQASTSLMVPKGQLTRVAGMNQTLEGGIHILSPALGALAVSWLPLPGVLAIDVITAALAIGILGFVPVRQPMPQPAATRVNGRSWIWKDVLAAVRYVRQWPGLVLVLSAAVLINFFLTPAYALLPLLVTKRFGGGALHLGSINSAGGIGLVTGGVVLSAWGGFKRRIHTSVAGVIGIGLGTLLTGLAPAGAFGVAVIGVLLARFMSPFANGPVFAVLQSSVVPDMQGRVFMLAGSASAAAAPLAMAIAGPLSDALGIGLWYILGGAMCVLLGVVLYLIPAVAHLEEHRGSSADAGTLASSHRV